MRAQAMSPDEPTTACMRDGSRVTIRLSTADDEPALFGFLARLCPDARRLRFFTGAVDVGEAAHLSAESDPRRAGLLAFNEDGDLVGHALYIHSARMSPAAPKWRSR